MDEKHTGQDRDLRKTYEGMEAEAAKRPGVAEMMRVYANFSPYAPRPAVHSRVVTHYSSGGNG